MQQTVFKRVEIVFSRSPVECRASALLASATACESCGVMDSTHTTYNLVKCQCIVVVGVSKSMQVKSYLFTMCSNTMNNLTKPDDSIVDRTKVHTRSSRYHDAGACMHH